MIFSMEERLPRRSLIVAVVCVPIVAAALWLPRWWEHREYREAEKIAGIAAPMAAGTVAEARKQLETGTAATDVASRLGKPSMSVATEGRDSRREIWTYYFPDGTMLINITDGRVQRVSTTFGAPKIPTSARPE